MELILSLETPEKVDLVLQHFCIVAKARLTKVQVGWDYCPDPQQFLANKLGTNGSKQQTERVYCWLCLLYQQFLNHEMNETHERKSQILKSQDCVCFVTFVINLQRSNPTRL